MLNLSHGWMSMFAKYWGWRITQVRMYITIIDLTRNGCEKCNIKSSARNRTSGPAFPVQRSIANCATKSNCRKRATSSCIYTFSGVLGRQDVLCQAILYLCCILLFVFSTSYFPFNNHVCKINGKSTIFYCGLKHPNRRDNITHYKNQELTHTHTCMYAILCWSTSIYTIFYKENCYTISHTSATQHETTQRMRNNAAQHMHLIQLNSWRNV